MTSIYLVTIIPSGYMLLEFKDNLPMEYQQSSDNCYHDVHLI